MPVVETDETLLAQWRSQNDNTAFDALFQRHYERVYRVVYNLVGSREEAEDLAQETFLALYHTPPSLKDNEGGLAAWLCRVALNRGYNTLRSNRRAQQRMERLGEPLSGMEGSDPYSMAVRAEERAYVQAILAQLPERQSKLLLLRYAGLSYAEIAATLGIAPGSVGTLLARAERAFLAKSSQPVVH
jgi:RNA polymerase sigma-70 factor (ECF subfamily)